VRDVFIGWRDGSADQSVTPPPCPDESEGSTISNNQRYFMCLDEFQQITLEARRMKGKMSPFLTVYKRIIHNSLPVWLKVRLSPEPVLLVSFCEGDIFNL
jgi:hypothetical protein